MVRNKGVKGKGEEWKYKNMKASASNPAKMPCQHPLDLFIAPNSNTHDPPHIYIQYKHLWFLLKPAFSVLFLFLLPHPPTPIYPTFKFWVQIQFVSASFEVSLFLTFFIQLYGLF